MTNFQKVRVTYRSDWKNNLMASRKFEKLYKKNPSGLMSYPYYNLGNSKVLSENEVKERM
ncbi:MAG TPA: hypothetical protein VNR61_18955 [Niallia sp.]|nr:hypothetical protein [Niallia sp.]